jgi:hypothetical protein
MYSCQLHQRRSTERRQQARGELVGDGGRRVGHRLGVLEDVTLQRGEDARLAPTRHLTRPAQVGPLMIPKMPRWAGFRVL